MPRSSAPIILAMLVAATSAPASAAPAADTCLAGPNGTAPEGRHWFYRVDRAKHRNCWYLGAQGAKIRRTATRPRTPAPAEPAEPAGPAVAEATSDGPTASEPPAPAPAPAPAGARVADAVAPTAAFTTRWPSDSCASVADCARRRMQGDTVDPATRAPERIATRSVATTTERPPAQPARPAPAVTGERTVLPAALLGIALLLAIVGTMLVRASRRRVRIWEEPVGLRERVAIHAHPSRTARDPRAGGDGCGLPARDVIPGFLALRRDSIPSADSETSVDDLSASVDSCASVDSRASVADYARRRMREDIAEATLQPAIDPVPSEAIAPAPDVEQSLRQLLQAWQRLAA
jgi:hypothetical protein